MTVHRRSVLFLLIAAVLWSTSGVLLKSLPSLHWLLIAGGRSLCAFLIFLPGLGKPRPPLGTLLLITIIYAALVSTLMGSMQLGTAAQGIWLQYSAPAFITLWMWLIMKQRIRKRELVAVVITLSAIMLMVTADQGVAHRQSVALGLISGLLFASFIILLKGLSHFSPDSLFAWTNLGTALLVLPWAFFVRGDLSVTSSDVGLLAVMGIFQLGLAYYFFQWGLANTRAIEASLIILLEPLLNPVWTYLVMRELPSPRVIMGCTLIAFALVAIAIIPNHRGKDKT